MGLGWTVTSARAPEPTPPPAALLSPPCVSRPASLHAAAPQTTETGCLCRSTWIYGDNFVSYCANPDGQSVLW